MICSPFMHVLCTEPSRRGKTARVATVQIPTAGDADTSGEEDGEEEQASVDDSEILEDLPDDTEVRVFRGRSRALLYM